MRPEHKHAYKRGDIVYVNIGETTGSEQSGKRPAVIVSNNKANTHSPVLIVVYLTTKKKNPLPTHARVMCIKPSIALCEEPTSVDISRIGEPFKTCTKKEMEEIDLALGIALGLKEC